LKNIFNATPLGMFTAKVPMIEIEKFVNENFDLRPKGLITMLDLKRLLKAVLHCI
jgi:S-adenosylmethionine synthetase